MNELINNVASAGDLAECSADMRILICIFMFCFVITIFATIIVGMKGIGK